MLERVGPSCVQVRLMHLAQDGTRMPGASWDGPLDTSAKRLDCAEDIEERAARETNILGGIHAWYIEVDGEGGKTLATEIFRLSAESLPNGKSISTEPANEGGVLAQMMRHHEVMAKQYMWDRERVSETLASENSKLRARNENLEDKLFKTLDTVREAILGERQHELELLKAKAKNELMLSVGKQVQGLLPEVASAFVHKQAKAPAAAAAIGIQEFLKTITPEQFDVILSTLRPEQAMVLVQAMKRIAEAEAEKAKQNAPPAPPATEAANGSTPH
jgi:hypothetical protein